MIHHLHHLGWATVALLAGLSACGNQLGPQVPAPEASAYTLSFVQETSRIFAPGPEIKLDVVLADAAAEDLTCSLTVPENDAEFVNLYNSKYASDCVLAPEGVYTLGSAVIEKGQRSATLQVQLDLARIKADVSGKPYILPVTLTTDGAVESHDVRYLAIPTFTTSESGHPVVHLPGGDAWMEVWHTEGVNTKACIFCPGGGYSSLSGQGVTTEPGVFAGQGVVCAYLHYTLPINDLRGRYDLPTQNAEDAVDVLRAHAAEWGGYSLVGTSGRSAGGHLAGATAVKHPDKVDFQILLYPVVSMDISRSHEGSCYYFLGDERPAALVEEWSLDKCVTAETPRAFVYYAMDDTVVPQRYNGMVYCQALKAAGVPCQEECYETGGHSTPKDNNYPDAMFAWLKTF